MNLSFRLVLNILFIIFLSSFCAVLHSQTIYHSYCDGKIYFKFKDNTNVKIQLDKKSEADFNKVDFLQNVSSVFNFTKLLQPFAVNNDRRLLLTYELYFNNYKNVDSLINYLKNLDNIEYAEKVPLYKIFYTPNDPLYNSSLYDYNWKWWLDKVNASQAWNITKGDTSILVGIADNAMWTAHPDLTNQLFAQYDIADKDNNVNPPAESDDSSKFEWSHGTFISGMIAAVQDNNIGITGIAPHVKLLFCKASLNKSDGLELDYGFQAVQWLLQNHANVINMSWGSSGSSIAEQDMVNASYNAGVVLVAAAGNDGVNALYYPAAYNHVISVASINDDNHRSSFSQYGTWITLSAPGGFSPDEITPYNIPVLSTTYNQAYIAQYFFPGQYYDVMEGTSMAAPVVTGISALMFSVNPELTPDDVTRCLKLSAVNIDNINPGFGGMLGAGYPDAYAAITCAQTASQLLSQFKANNINITKGQSVNFTDYSSGSPTSWSWSFPGGTPSASTLQNPSNIIYNQSGIYSVSLTVSKPGSSNSKTINNYINVIVSSSACDSVRYPQKPPYVVYTIGGGSGYYTGNNSFGFLGLAEYFSSSDYHSYNLIKGGAVKFGGAIGLDGSTATLCVWKNKNGAPYGSPLASKTVALGTIKTDVNNNVYTFINFDTPLSITGPFYLGILLPTAKGDTAIIVSDTSGSVKASNTWAYSSGGWESFAYGFNNSFNIMLAISPLMCTVLDYVPEINNTATETVNVYPNPAQNILNIVFTNKDLRLATYDLRLFDLFGNEIKSTQISEIMNGNKIQINVSGLASGLYLLNIISDNSVITKKISIIK